jgi:SMI1 / KNR4 family (SUKH-1)
MAIKNIIESIVQKHKENGIDVNIPATPEDIMVFEQQIGFALPADFKEFYTICNGFGCNEDIFNIIALGDITSYPQDYGANCFYFSEYMIYSDMWGLRFMGHGKYEIFNGSYPDITMTSSLEEFLNRFLKGNVFETDGLYDWHEKLQNKL